MYIRKVHSIYYTLRSNKNFEKISFRQDKQYKQRPLFLWRPPTHYHSFTFNLRFLYELKHQIRLSKTMCGVFHF